MPFRSSARGTYGPQGIKIIKGPLPPVWVTSGALPTATTDPYSQQLSATDDSGDNPLYSLESGSLPTGLTLSPAGLISGSATGASTTYSFTVRATDVNGRFSVSNTITIQTILIINGFPSQSPGGMTTTTDNGKFLAYRTSQGDSTITVVPNGEIVMALIGTNGSITGTGSSSCNRYNPGGRGGMSIVRFTVPSGVTSLLLSVGGAGQTGISGGPFAGGYNGGGSSGSWYGGGGQFGSGYQAGSGGGGYTGVFVSSKTQGNTYLMVGGGGGAGQGGSNGAGGGLNENGQEGTGGNGGTTTSGGAFTSSQQYYNQVGGSGSALQGGTGANSWLDQGGGGGAGYFGGSGGSGGGGCSGGIGAGGSGIIRIVTASSYYNYTDIASLKSGLTTYYGLTGSAIPSNLGTSANSGGIFVWAVT